MKWGFGEELGVCQVVKIHTQTVPPQLSSILLSSAQSCTAHNSSRTHSNTHTLFTELMCHLRLFFGSVSRSFVTSTDDIVSRRLFMWERVLYGKVNGSVQAVSPPNRRELSAIWLCISAVKLGIIQVSGNFSITDTVWWKALRIPRTAVVAACKTS